MAVANIIIETAVLGNRFTQSRSCSQCQLFLHSDTVSEVREGVAPEVVGAEEASEEYYGAYDEGYQMADALLSLRDSAAAKDSKSDEVYVDQRNWHEYQGEGDPIYQPRQHEVSTETFFGRFF